MDSKTYNKEYHAKNRAVLNPRAAEWRRKHPKEFKAYQVAYVATHKEEAKAYRISHKTERMDRWQRYKYGISLEDKLKRLASQNGKCAICKTSEPGKKGWHTDHDHETNVFRGVLCSACNRTIGYAREDILRLKRCAAYLMKHKGLSIHDVFKASRAA